MARPKATSYQTEMAELDKQEKALKERREQVRQKHLIALGQAVMDAGGTGFEPAKIGEIIRAAVRQSSASAGHDAPTPQEKSEPVAAE